MKNGLIHIYTGDGKGKTTAAMGLCLRAAGHGFHVGLAQFLKTDKSGEITILSGLENVYVFPYLSNIKFTFAMDQQEMAEAHNFYTNLLNEIIARSKEFDIILLDEIIPAITNHLVDKDILINFLKNRPVECEIILTGRNPPSEILDLADYISDIKLVRHPYEKGIHSRKGIEW